MAFRMAFRIPIRTLSLPNLCFISSSKHLISRRAGAPLSVTRSCRKMTSKLRFEDDCERTINLR